MNLITDVFVIFISIVSTISSQSTTKFALKPEYMNKELTTHRLAIHYNCQTMYKCTYRCMKTSGCLSMSYHRREQTCLLHSVNSLSVSTEDFLIVPGSLYSDVDAWPMSQHCHSNTCADDDEHCQPNGNPHVCFKTSTPICLKNHPMSVNCYKRYTHSDFPAANMCLTRSSISLEECIEYCYTNCPNFRSIQHNDFGHCFCKSAIVIDYLKHGSKLTYASYGNIYDRLL